ncbi:MAG: hypothetical protein Q4C34_05755, partial [Bacteroidales bacterium]|nr:hypothetical protein [Bacteroidales bacterium]
DPVDPVDPDEVVLSTEAYTAEGWNNYLDVDCTNETFNPGDQIFIYLNNYNGGQLQYGVVRDEYKNWNDYDENLSDVYKVTLTASQAKALSGNKFRIKGQNFSVTKVTCKHTGAPVVEQDGDIYWLGSQDLSWDGTGYAVNRLESFDRTFRAGDFIVIDGDVTEADKGAVMVVVANPWAQWHFAEDLGSLPVEFMLTADQAAALNNGTQISIQGQNITIKSIKYKAAPADTRRFEMVDLFIPGVYPSPDMCAKTEFGLYSTTREIGPTFAEGGSAASDALGQTWMGSGRMVNLGTEDEPEWKYMFYEEWWDKAQIEDTENTDYTAKHWYQKWYLPEDNTFPIKLSRELVSNFAKVKRGDIIIVNLTSYDPKALGSAPAIDENNNFDLGTQGQLGTYDPAGIDPNDPFAGFESITLADGANYRDFGEGTYEIEWTVGPAMLEQITRYGLSINGRRFYLNWVKAKVFIDDEADFEGDAETTETETFFNYTIPASEFSDVEWNSIITVSVEKGNLYNEEVIAKYKGTGDNRVYLGSETNWYDEPKIHSDAGDTHIRYSFVDKDGIETRLHVMSRLHEEHFPAAAAYAEGARSDNSIYFVDGIAEGRAYRNGDLYNLEFRVQDPDIIQSLKDNGMKLRGARYAYKNVTLDQTLTGVEDVTTDKIDFNAPYEVYTLAGVRVAEMIPGNIYLVRQGEKVEKVVIQ